MNLMLRPVLQLNKYFEPLLIIKARHALTLVTKGKAVVVVPTRTRIYPGISDVKSSAAKTTSPPSRVRTECRLWICDTGIFR